MALVIKKDSGAFFPRIEIVSLLITREQLDYLAMPGREKRREVRP